MLVDENAGGFDGEFATDLMQRYDIEMDFTPQAQLFCHRHHKEGKVRTGPPPASTASRIRGWGAQSDQHVRHEQKLGMTLHPEGPTISVSIDGEVEAAVDTNIAQNDAGRYAFAA